MLLAMSVPARAFACSCAGYGIFAADPKDNSSGAPLDVAPVVIGTFDPATVKLADESGAPVELTLEAGPGPLCAPQWVELKPKAALRSNTRYRISATSPDKTSSQVSFTTGDRALGAMPLETPKLARADMVYRATTCASGPALGTPMPTTLCTGGFGDPRQGIEVIARSGDTVLARNTLGVFDTSSYELNTPPTCVEFRRRASNGQRSEPTVICGAALGGRPSVPSDQQGTIFTICNDGRVGAGRSEEEDAGVVTASDAGAVVVASAAGAMAASTVNAQTAAAASGSPAAPMLDAGTPPPPPAAETKTAAAGCAIAAVAKTSGALWLLPLGALGIRARRRLIA